MKNNFLTIPDAPNYEINSDLIVRNKKTKQIMKIWYNNGTPIIQLHFGEKLIQRTPRRFRAEALAAVEETEYFPVPSLGYRYETNKNGDLRSVRTKLPIKRNKKNCYNVYVDGKNISVGRSSLKAEVFGIKRKHGAVQVSLNKNGRQLVFDNLKAAACFLATQYYYSVGTFHNHLKKRKRIIFDWRAKYLDE